VPRHAPPFPGRWHPGNTRTTNALPALEETITRAELQDEARARKDWMSDHAVFDPLPEVHIPTEGFDRH
jgi:hypothetical protein